VRVHIPELALDAELRADADGRAAFSLPASPELWSPESPRRYEVSISSEQDSVCDWVGFRRIEVDGTRILLNGAEIFLRGIAIHEEAPLREGRAHGEDDARVLLGWAKDLGCNFVRLAHYTHDESMLRVADELGLLVWGEVPVYWNLDWENAQTLDNAKRQLRTMLERDRNRAAFVLCSIGNEAPGTPERLSFMGQLAAHVREVDDQRLVTCALMAVHKDGEMILDDPMGEHLDVMGCNEYLGWYYGDIETLPDVKWSSAYDKPLVMSELGAGALAGRHGDATEPFCEEHQAAVYEGQIAMMEKIPFLSGLSPWILRDFRSPRRVLPGIQDYYNRKGLVSERGQRKLAFSVLQSWYRKLATRA
jgi:beta-glucuronidase